MYFFNLGTVKLTQSRLCGLGQTHTHCLHDSTFTNDSNKSADLDPFKHILCCLFCICFCLTSMLGMQQQSTVREWNRKLLTTRKGEGEGEGERGGRGRNQWHCENRSTANLRPLNESLCKLAGDFCLPFPAYDRLLIFHYFNSNLNIFFCQFNLICWCAIACVSFFRSQHQFRSNSYKSFIHVQTIKLTTNGIWKQICNRTKSN